MTALASGRPLPREYQEVRVREGRRSGLTIAIAIHRTVAGRSLGGCRFEPYASADDAIADVKRLAHAMTFKAAVAGLRFGGGKGVIAAEPDSPPDAYHRRLALRDFAELVESFRGQYITAQDAGTSEEDISFMARFTDHLSGRPRAQGGSGDPSPYTAHGIEVAIRASLTGELAGRHVIVLGLGHVGSKLAQRLHDAGAQLTVSDLDPDKRRLAEHLGARWLEPHQAISAEADVFAPCALGGILNEETIPGLNVSVVAGAANNQLADDSAADELRERGIVWAPDFVANAGGLIAVADELHGFDLERVQRSIERIGETLQEIYARAAAAGTNPLIAARELAAERSGGLDDNDR
jgi:leucine dehydrogenase